ncbi:MAG: CbbQ/NirQ/NorQ/GpvN family protein [Planctomycetes bacterium]|nr:CbbQ/NirQ/NorQ/GpvN family protein [Planctomycetota bacterium]
MDASAPSEPYYRPISNEVEVFKLAWEQRLALLLKGPTGCGKSRFVEAMARKLERPLISVACHDETTSADLLGRWLVQGGDTVWQDGPVTRALRQGAILYLDEVAEAREDVIVVLHPLTDHRRELLLDRHDEVLHAPVSFMLVASFNPGYQRGLKEMKPSTRQRFVTLAFDYPPPKIEAEIVATEGGIERKLAERFVGFATKVRKMTEVGLSETVSTRLLVSAAKLTVAGLPPRRALSIAAVEALSDDREVVAALNDVVSLMV